MPLDQVTSPDPMTIADAPAGTQRRHVLRHAGIGAALLGAFGAGGTALTPRRAEAAVNDGDILNFALNLEYLEAEFYLRATTGKGLLPSEVDGSGTAGAVTGGSAVPFQDQRLRRLALDIANDEHSHVTFLRKALGSYKVARPAISLQTAFIALARAAGIAGPGEYYSPFYNDFTFLLGAYIFEDVGVTAYLGAAPLISNPAYLSAAGGILGVEAYHAGAIRSFIANDMGEASAMAAAAISKLRATLSQAQDDSGPVINGSINLAPTNADALCFPRTTRQVLNVVYGGVNATKGLFFPNGMNGTIKA